MIERWRPGSTLAIATGLMFAAISAAFLTLSGSASGHWLLALGTSVLGGAIFGAVIGPYSARPRTDARPDAVR